MNWFFCSNLTPHHHVILHAGLARSCRIHCFNKRKTNSSLWRSCPSVWIKGGGKWSYRHSPTVCNGHPNFRRARVNYSNMDSASSPSAPRRMTGWKQFIEEWKFSDPSFQPKEDLMPCRLIGLMQCASVLDWSCANWFWNDALRIGYGMKIFLLVIDWCVYWIWIDAM